MTVTTDTLAVALGRTAPPPDSLEDRQWSMWIADAAMLIELRRAALNAAQPDDARLDYVIREAVVAHIRRPDDATQITVSVDDGNSSRTYRSGAGRIVIRDEWWTLLGLTEPAGAFSFDTAPPGTGHLPWCAVMFGAAYCSCGTVLAGYPIYEDPEL